MMRWKSGIAGVVGMLVVGLLAGVGSPVGQAAVEDDDQRLLARGMFVYDALYAHCQHQLNQEASS